jgi:hypothetical protein
MHAGALALLVAAGGCNRNGLGTSGVIQTKFPGQVTAGGGTSGQILAQNAKPVTDATYAGGHPGMAGGAGGNTGGAAMGGTVQESGQGPSRGTSTPAGAGQQGAVLPPGDMGKAGAEHARPGGAGQQGAAPPAGETAAKPAGQGAHTADGAAVQRDNPAPAAPAR